MADKLNLLDGPVPVESTAGLGFEFGKSGYNPDIDPGTAPADIWPVGGLYIFPTAAAAGTIASTSANDSAAGTGARTIRISGLDDTFSPLFEDVTLNGITPVALVNNYFRINSATVQTAGSTEFNEGDIDITVGGNILVRIQTGFSTDRNAIYTVPDIVAASRFFRWWASVGKQAATQVSLELLIRDNGVIRDVLTIDLNTQGECYVNHEIPTRNIVVPGIDIWARCTFVSGSNVAIASGFDVQQV